MTDEELNQRLNEWEVDVASVTDSVMQTIEDTPNEMFSLAELLGEVRALRQEMRGLRAEVAGLREAVVSSQVRPAAHLTIKGYPLLPFASTEDQMPFFQ